MGTVTNISTKQTYRKVLGAQLEGFASHSIAYKHTDPTAPHWQADLEQLERASGHYLLALLELAHKDEEHAREQAQARESLARDLEAEAYAAMIAGVPEADIYELDSYAGQALENAIRKVEAAA